MILVCFLRALQLDVGVSQPAQGASKPDRALQAELEIGPRLGDQGPTWSLVAPGNAAGGLQPAMRKSNFQIHIKIVQLLNLDD